MKVVLLFPGISGGGFGSYGREVEDSWINHGLCSLSASAKNAGYAVELVDLRCLTGWRHLRRLVDAKKPDIVGITMMSNDFDAAVQSARIIKDVSPHTIVIVGGPHPSIDPDEVLREECFDHIVTGEGEITFPDLLRRLENASPSPRLIHGIVPENLDDLPFVDRQLFAGFEVPPPGYDAPFFTLIAGRGCRFNCSFCQPAEQHIFGKSVRRRSAANVIKELVELRDRYGFGSMMIHDDCITEDRPWVTEFCHLYEEHGFTQPFSCQSRADIICRHEDLIALMARCGLRWIYIGFESGNQRILNFLRKGTKVEHNYRAAEICRKNGVKIHANYMMGIPTETKDEVMDTVRMIRMIRPDSHGPAFFTPLPGSDLYKYCMDRDLSLNRGHNYRRNATDPKIKGVDYRFLWHALAESRGIRTVGDNRILRSLEAGLVAFLLCRPRLKRIVKRLLEPFGLIRRRGAHAPF